MAGTVVKTGHLTGAGPEDIQAISFTFTGDAATGSMVTVDVGVYNVWGTLLAIGTNPGATAPTDNYDITLVDADGVDRLDGVGGNRDTATSERAPITGSPWVARGESLTLTISNNSVASAIIVVTIWFTYQVNTAPGIAQALSYLVDSVAVYQQGQPIGSGHLSSTQVVPTTVTGTLAIARATRVRCIIINNGNLPVQLGETTATTAMAALNPGASVTLSTPALIAGILASGTFAGKVDVLDEYN